MTENEKYQITGMSCAACSARVDKAVRHLAGVREVSVNLLTNSMLVSYDAPLTSEAICAAVERAGYGASMLVTASFGLHCAAAAVEHIVQAALTER